MIISLLKKKKNQIVLASIMSAVSGAANIWVLRLVNEYATGIDHLSVAAMWFSLSLLTMVAMGFAARVFIARMSANFFYDMRRAMIDAIASLTFEKQVHVGSHRLYSSLTSDVNVISGFLASLPNHVFNLTATIFCLFYLAHLSLSLFLVFLGFVIIGVGVSQFVIIRLAKVRYRDARLAQDQLYFTYDTIINGGKEFEHHARRKHDFHTQRFDPASSSFRQHSINASIYSIASTSWFSGVLFLAVGSMVIIAQSVLSLSGTELLQFILVVLYVTGPIAALVDSLGQIANVSIVVDRLKSLELDLNRAQQSTVGQVLSLDQSADVRVESFRQMVVNDLVFCYPEDESQDGERRFSIGPVSMTINRGDIIYFIGGNGSGKTTLSMVLAGLFRPTSGDVLVNGKHSLMNDRAQYSQYFSCVFPDYFLFDKILSKKQMTIEDDQVRYYLKKLGLDGKVSVAEGIISTTKLSQGQKKRLALLIAFFDQSEMYIFDEWAAEQDPQFRAFFYHDILPELKAMEKTVIVVTHDDRYFQCADRLVCLDEGKVISLGEKEKNSL